MKKQMKRTVYEAPVTELFRVELEGNFCGSADVKNPGPDQAGIQNQDINQDFTDITFDAGNWSTEAAQ